MTQSTSTKAALTSYCNKMDFLKFLFENQNVSEEKSQNLIIALAFIFVLTCCTTYGTRTRDSSVKGRRLNLLTNAAFLGVQIYAIKEVQNKLFIKIIA